MNNKNKDNVVNKFIIEWTKDLMLDKSYDFNDPNNIHYKIWFSRVRIWSDDIYSSTPFWYFNIYQLINKIFRDEIKNEISEEEVKLLYWIDLNDNTLGDKDSLSKKFWLRFNDNTKKYKNNLTAIDRNPLSYDHESQEYQSDYLFNIISFVENNSFYYEVWKNWDNYNLSVYAILLNENQIEIGIFVWAEYYRRYGDVYINYIKSTLNKKKEYMPKVKKTIVELEEKLDKYLDNIETFYWKTVKDEKLISIYEDFKKIYNYDYTGLWIWKEILLHSCLSPIKGKETNIYNEDIENIHEMRELLLSISNNKYMILLLSIAHNVLEKLFNIDKIEKKRYKKVDWDLLPIINIKDIINTEIDNKISIFNGIEQNILYK